ncbi:hypothetical protein ACRTDU_01390 [Sunxiuqinia elliptica]|uniref:Outer membrane lipoprotein-sorting protein n=1 Tax=Sunxiuqinia elliptica TaxID=655355 RepID=A0A1I2IZR6_9BACT|nr:hypothetical protein [Sunxiuqinia elliptica]SFF48002.1 hypothetical protein SAMN05216283_107110 [Sunxiuqinia elliptica]
MKTGLTLLLVLLSLWATSQTDKKTIDQALEAAVKTISASDIPIPFVKYQPSTEREKQPACFINGQFVKSLLIQSLPSQVIDSLKVFRKEITIDGENYYGKLDIKLKKDYQPKFISLMELKKKHTSLSNQSAIFMLDNEVIKGEYTQCLVDENNILQLIIDQVKTNDTAIDLIRILTKTEDNIKQAQTIHIRGSQYPLFN